MLNPIQYFNTSKNHSLLCLQIFTPINVNIFIILSVTYNGLYRLFFFLKHKEYFPFENVNNLYRILIIRFSGNNMIRYNIIYDVNLENNS